MVRKAIKPEGRQMAEYFTKTATPPKGTRVEIPVHYDRWMQGARFGVVTVYRHGRDGQSDYVKVKLDHPQVRKQLKVWRHDWPYMKRI
jgi:hypothetical protein